MEQVSWAYGLNGSGTVTYHLQPGVNVAWSGNWRLPNTVDGAYSAGYDGTTSVGYNIITSEMGHLYYTELGNKGYIATNGSYPQPGYGLVDTGPFSNFLALDYWSETAYAAFPDYAWAFFAGDGFQGGPDDKGFRYSYGLAVRPGQFDFSISTVPEPSTYALLCISLGVVGYARERKRGQI